MKRLINKKIIILLISLIIFLFLAGNVLSEDSEGGISEWRMDGRYLNRTAWDGVSYENVGVNMTFVTVTVPGSPFLGPVVVNGMVYVGTEHGFTRLNASNITQVIDSYAGGQAWGSSNQPIIVNGYVYWTDYNSIYQFLENNISAPYKSYTYCGTSCTPQQSTVAVYNGFVYFGTGSRTAVPTIMPYVYQMNASDVSVMVHRHAGSALSVEFDSNPSIANGYVFIGARDAANSIQRLDANNVSQAIVSYNAGAISIYSSPVVYNGFVYVGTYDGVLHKLDATTLAQVASISVGAGSSTVNTVAIANGSIYATVGFTGLSSGVVYQLDADLNIISTFGTADIWSAPVVANGIVYVGQSTGVCYELYASNISQQFRNYSCRGRESVTVTDDYIYGWYDGTTIFQMAREDLPIPGVVCGDNITDPGEACDGINLSGQTCVSFGFDYGVLACSDLCTFNKSDCHTLGGGPEFPESLPPPPAPPLVVITPGPTTELRFGGFWASIKLVFGMLFTDPLAAFEELGKTASNFTVELIISVIIIGALLALIITSNKKKKRH